MKTATLEVPAAIADEFQEIPRAHVQDWSAVCQRFLEQQRKEIFLGNPTPEQRARHRDVLKWMLRFTRVFQATVADPDYPDPTLASELEGRVRQLEESWRMVENRMTDAAADQLIARHFPA